MKNSKSGIGKTARFCPECGFKLENGAMFCPNCGTKIDLPQITKQISSGGKADVTTKGKTTCPYCGEELEYEEQIETYHEVNVLRKA